MPWSDVVDVRDEQFHKRTDDPYWNESSFISFSAPEIDLMGLVYYYFRPNMNLAVAGIMIWDPTGEDIYNCRHYAWDQCMAIPPGTEMNEFVMPNGLRSKVIDLQREYRYTFKGLDCEADLTFSAAMDPYYMRDMNPAANDWTARGIPDDVTIGHFEQPGWMRGTVTIDGQTVAVDSASLRDRSWGPRPMLTNMPRVRGAYPFVFASPESSFHVFAPCPSNSDDDPIFDTVEPIVSGWYIRDGVMGNVVSGQRRCVERGDDGRPVREIIEAIDDLGRKLYAEGTQRTWFRLTGWTDFMLLWGLATWDYDGRHVEGENLEYFTFRHYRRMAAQLAGRNARV